MALRTLIVLPLFLAAFPAIAQDQGLPDEASVQGALDKHPSVAAARARVEAARAEAEALRRGSQEFEISGTYTRRDAGVLGQFNEYDAQLTRPIRLPGKGKLDREIGRYGIDAAENIAEDARHQAALLLAGHWFDWLTASALAEVDRTAVANYERSLAAVERREELGDASKLDVDLARAALARARIAAETSEGEARLARGRLSAHFPGIAIPATAPSIPAPEIADEELVRLRDQVEINSHEIAAAEAEARRSESVSARIRRDRLADPSVGVRVFSEFGGQERGVGLVFSMPLGGGYRRSLAERSEAEALAAQSDLGLVRFTVRETADADLANARFRLSAWQRSREALAAQMDALQKLRRGYELGEIDLADLLLGERMTHEAFRENIHARAYAARAVTRLRIDSHALWLAD